MYFGLIACLLASLSACSKSYKDYTVEDARTLGDNTISIYNNKKLMSRSFYLGENQTHSLTYHDYQGEVVLDDFYYETIYMFKNNKEYIYYKEEVISTKETTLDEFKD